MFVIIVCSPNKIYSGEHGRKPSKINQKNKYIRFIYECMNSMLYVLYMYLCICVTRTKKNNCQIKFNHGDESYNKAYHVQIINCFFFCFQNFVTRKSIHQRHILHTFELEKALIDYFFLVMRERKSGRSLRGNNKFTVTSTVAHAQID